MKHAIVCLLWDANLPALVHYLARRPCVVLAPSSYKGLHRHAETLAKLGAETQALDDYLTPELLAEIDQRVEAGVLQFAEDLSGEKWEGFCARERVAPEVAEHVVLDMARRLKEEMLLVEALHQAGQSLQIDLMVVNEDYTRLPRTAVAWAKAQGVPSLHVSHAMGLIRPYTVHKSLTADTLAVLGEHERQAFLDVGIAAERIVVTGNPRWDEYARAAEQVPAYREALLRQHGLSFDVPTLVFATTWVAWLSANDDLEARYSGSLRTYLQAIAGLRAQGLAFNAVIKDRPSNARLGAARVAELAAEMGLGAGDYVYATEEAFGWVLASDVVISIDSNMSVEAMLAGKPAVNLLNEIGLRMGPAFAADSGVLEVAPEALTECLVRLLSDAVFRQETIDKLRARAAFHNLGVDGLAARRVAELMLRMSGGPTVQESVSGGPKRYVWESLGGGAGERDIHEVYMSPPRREVVGLFNRTPRRVLEVGCSTGSTGKYIKEQYPGVWVAGVELSAAAARVAAQHMDVIIQQKFEDCEPEVYGITPGSIDTVILADVLEHMYDPWGVLVRIRPYLSADAQVIASIPNSRNLWLMNELANGRFPYAPVGLLDVTHIRFFTRTEIEKLFVETGYAVEAWGRTPDPRLHRMQMPPGSSRIETEKFILKDVTPEEFEDLKSLQFLVRATPSARHAEPTDAASARALPDAPALPVPVAKPKRSRQSGPLRIAVYSLDVQQSACPQIRFFAPLSRQAGVELVWGVTPTGVGSGWTANLDIEADVYVISRLFPGPGTEGEIEALFSKGKPVVYETDDLLIDLPPDNMHAAEYARKRPFIESVMQRAQGLVVSTSELAMRLARYNRSVFVLPNQIDYARFYQPPPDNGREVRIAVVGTSTRGSDFAVVDAALREVCRKFGKRARVVFIGAKPESWQGHAHAEFVDFLPDYAAFAARLKGLRLDIGVAPLADSAFNACKSPIKWQEFSALGMAGVYSFVPAYKDIITQGETGLLVDNVPEKWVAALSLLIEYPEKRLEIALKAQREVLKQHALQSDMHRAVSLYRRLATSLALPAAETPESTTTAEAVASEYEDEGAAENEPAEAFYRLWQIGHTPQVWDMGWIAAQINTWAQTGVRPPVLHWGVICLAGREDALARNIRDLYAQYYQSWHLTVVAEVAAPAALAELDRLNWLVSPPEHALTTLNKALMDFPADWVGMLEAGDGLPPHATFTLARMLLQHPDWVAVFSDEDRLDPHGERHSPYFKADLCPHRLRAAPFSLGGLFMLARPVFSRQRGFDPEFSGVEAWDLALRLLEAYPVAAIGHVAEVLCHRDEDARHTDKSGDALLQAAEASLRAHLGRINWHGEVRAGLLPGCFDVRPAIQGEPRVSILIPVGFDVARLQSTLPILIDETAYSHCEVLLVHGPDAPPAMLEYLDTLAALGSANLRVLAVEEVMPWLQWTAAASEARGEFLLCLDPALQVLHADWLEMMLGLVQEPGVGAVGARLINREGRLTHTGWVLGLNGMSLGDAGAGQVADEPGYYGRHALPQTCSALDGACLLMARSVWEAAGGIDVSFTQPEYAWADFCLRIQAQGLRTVWTPQATLLDGRGPGAEASVLSSEKSMRESAYRRDAVQIDTLAATWPAKFANDPAYNRNLSLMLPWQVEATPALTLDPLWRPAPRVLAMHADTAGCGEYRIIAPMRALQSAGKVMGWDAGGYFHPREYARIDADSMIMQRQLNWSQIELIERIARFSRAFRVYELDDLVTNLPIQSSQKKVFVQQKDLNKRFRKAVSLFHRFVVSTEFLAETYRGYCDELVVVPNYLERLRWGGLAPQRLGGTKARVGWAGSSTHAGDLRLIVDVVKETAQEVDWIFFGMCPDSIRHLVKEFHEPVRLSDYAAKLASLNLDLAIAPLEDVPFNHGKSHLRLLEYGVLGFPVICTDITPYRGDYPVTRVPNKFKGWVDAIRSHVSDRDELARRGDRLREHVRARWMLEDHLDVWLKAWLPN